MCGFCGFIDLNKQKDDTSYEIIRRMNDVIQHRGPDDEGFYTDQGHQLFFHSIYHVYFYQITFNLKLNHILLKIFLHYPFS